jgi:branched-chain amino acid transport system permease protein
LFASALVSGLVLGGIYALVGAGLNLIFGVIKIINFAQGALLMFGAYLSYWIVIWTDIDPYLTLPFVVLGMGILGYIIQITLINPVLGQERTSQLLITFGISLLIQNGALALWGPEIRFVETFVGYKTFDLFGIRVGASSAIAIAGAATIISIFFLFLNKTRTGIAIRAVAQQSDSALLSGIDVKKIYALAFAIGSAMVGAASVLIVPIYDIFPLMGEQFGVIAFIVVVLGGLGHIQGAAVAGVFLGVTQNLFAVYVSNQLSIAILFLIFLVTLLFRPQGIFIRRMRVS